MRFLPAAIVSILGLALAGAQPSSPAATATQPATKSATPAKPRSNLDYWLQQSGQDPAGGATVRGPAAATKPQDEEIKFYRPDALPGVMVMSDGRLLPGGLYTTREKNFEVWVESEKRFRQIPFLSILSITAVVTEEAIENEWRWKAMGDPEKVYTGRSYPTRRFLWEFHLIDGSRITGAVKGQPVWIEVAGKAIGPALLAERSKGEFGQKLPDLVYVRRIIVSRTMMNLALKGGPEPKDLVKP